MSFVPGLGLAITRALAICMPARKLWSNTMAGQFPSDVEALARPAGDRRLPAAAVAAIAFDFPAVPGRWECRARRVAAFIVEEELPAAKPVIRTTCCIFTPKTSGG